jgi:TPR repeat protein
MRTPSHFVRKPLISGFFFTLIRLIESVGAAPDRSGRLIRKRRVRMHKFTFETFTALIVAVLIAVGSSSALARPGDEADAIAAANAAAAEAEIAAAKDLNNARAAFDDRDYARALDMLLPLAEDGNADAQTLIGFMYRTGLLGIADFDEAALWFEVAIEQRHPDAFFNLGLMYFQHELLPPDGSATRYSFSEAAFTRFREAAELGHAKAQLYLGHMYAEGLGVERDPIEAYKWYQLSAWQRNSLASSARDRLSGKLSSEQLDEAKASAQAFQVSMTPE